MTDPNIAVPVSAAEARRMGATFWTWLRSVPRTLMIGVLAVFAVFHFVAYPGRLSHDPLFNSPHENVRYQLAEQWLETGRPTYPLPSAGEIQANIDQALTPRDAGRIGDDVVPKDFVYSLALVTGLMAIDPRLPLVLTTASSVALLVVVGSLARLALNSRRQAVLATSLFAASTAFWSAGAGLVETGATTPALYLGGVLALLHRRHRFLANDGSWRGARYDVIAALCFASTIGTHYATALLVMGTILAFVWPPDRGLVRRLLVLGGTVVLALSPILIFNAWLYGSPTTDGYSAGVDFLEGSIGENSGGVFAMRPALLWEHAVRYGLRAEVLALLGLAAVGWWISFRRVGPSDATILGRAAILGGLPYLVFTGARPLSGVGTFLVNASFMRYAAPLVAIVAIAAASGAIVVYQWRRSIASAAVVLAIAGALWVNLYGVQGPLETMDVIPTGTVGRDTVFEVVAPDAFILTGRADKTVWPQRQTLTAQFLLEPATSAEFGDDTHIYMRYPSPAHVAAVIIVLMAEEHEVYLWNDTNWMDRFNPTAFEALDFHLATSGGLERRATAVIGLWAFGPKPPAPPAG